MPNTLRATALLTLASLVAGCASTPSADLVVLGGQIHTMDGRGAVETRGGTVASALCVREARIVFVGSNEQAKKQCVGSRTRTVTLAGELVLPGFIDSHMHLFGGSFSASEINLSLADTLPKLLAALEQLKANNPGQEPLFARGWQNHLFPPSGPTSQILDEIFGQRTVVLGSVDGHSAWFSSHALAAAGLDASTADPEPGVSYFERNPETGNLTGTARESAGWETRNRLIRSDANAYRKQLLRWLPRAAEAGLTGAFDAGMSAPTEVDAYEILAELDREQQLTLRTFTSTATGGRDDDPVARLQNLKRTRSSSMVTPTAVKIFADGVPEAHTAFLDRDYLDRPGFRGHPMTPAAQIRQIIQDAQEAGLPVHVHAIGTAAITLTLDAIAAAKRLYPQHDPRHAIAHMDFVARQDYSRFASLDVVAQTSIQWATKDPSFNNIAAFVGEDLMENAYPVRSLVESGVTQSFGSDWPAAAFLSTFEPLTLIEVAVTRRLPGRQAGEVRNAKQKLTVAQAVKAITAASAYQVGMEDQLGSLTEGKLADFVVLDQDIFAIPAHRIHATRSVLTVVDGRVVHEALPAAKTGD